MKTQITFLFILLFILSNNDLFGQCSACNTTGCSPAASATGTCAFAQGDEAVASGNYSVSLGQETVASSTSAISIGMSTTASGANSVAIGQNASASTANSVSIGGGTADGTISYAIGPRVLAYGDNSFAIGDLVYADEDFSYNYIFGRGATEIPSYFINDISNSMMFGMNSTLPTMFIEGANGVGTWGIVGIGTTDPDGILHLREESAINTDLVIEKADTKEARVVYHNGSTEAAYISLDASENLMMRNSTSDKDIIFNINDGGSNTEVMRVDGDVSRVGIGTTTPGQKLEVSGGNINVATSTNGYMINGTLMLWNYGNTTDLFVGHSAGNSSMSGHNNTYVGTSSGNATSSGVNNTFVGFESGKVNSTGTRNSFMGTNSGIANNSGQYNTFNGYNSGSSNTSGLYNTNIGRDAGWTNSTGSHNTMIGQQAGYDNTAGNNTLIGSHAGENFTSGGYNVCLGYIAGNSHTTTTTSTFIGYNADATGSYEDCAAIGANSSVNDDHKIRIGSSTIEVIEGQVDFTTSDGRFKFNVTEEVSGLDFIKRLRPVSYQFDTEAFDEFLGVGENLEDSLGVSPPAIDYGPSSSIIRTGFIAQEVEQAAIDAGFITDIVHTPNHDQDNYSLQYGVFVVPLVKAVQEQQAKIEELEELIRNCCSAPSNGSMTIPNNILPQDEFGKENQTTEVELRLIDNIILYQNIPNPFTSETTINYYLPQSVNNAKMIFYNDMGQSIKEVILEHRGNASVKINSSDLARGFYSYSLIVDEKIFETKRMLKK